MPRAVVRGRGRGLALVPDGSFDLVVSTLSMHHWADPSEGVAEMARVLRPGGGSSLRLVGATPWRWPWSLSPIERIDLRREA